MKQNKIKKIKVKINLKMKQPVISFNNFLKMKIFQFQTNL